jgi:alpha-glucosidase (family GH31 glycosyl hydrolase)
MFVAIMTTNASSRKVQLPPIDTAWVDWFTGTKYASHALIDYAVPLASFPVFQRAGAILPLDLFYTPYATRINHTQLQSTTSQIRPHKPAGSGVHVCCVFVHFAPCCVA